MCQSSGTVEFSSGDEGLVRPNVGRDVATKTVASVHQVPSAAGAMSSSVSDGAGRDVAQSQKASTKSASGFGPGHRHASNCTRQGVVSRHCGRCPTVRSQDMRVEPEVIIVHHMESDRESNTVVQYTEPDALTTVVSDAPEVGRTDGRSLCPSRRVVLVPGSEEGAPQSIQDRVPSTEPARGMEIPTTVPASSEALRAVMDPHLNHGDVRPTAMDSIQIGETQQAHRLVNRRDVVESSSRVRVELGVDEVRTRNRFAELSEDSDEESVESAVEDAEVVVPHDGSRVVGQVVAVPASASFEEFGRVA